MEYLRLSLFPKCPHSSSIFRKEHESHRWWLQSLRLGWAKPSSSIQRDPGVATPHPRISKKSQFQTVCCVGRPHVRPGPDECVLIFVSENMLRITGEREIGKDSSWSPVLGMRWKPQRGCISVCLSNGSYHSLSGWRGRQRQGRLVQPRSFHKHVLLALSTAESQAEAKLHAGSATS